MSNLIFPVFPGAARKVLRIPAAKTQVQEADSGQELRLGKRAAPRYRYEHDVEFLRTAQPYAEFQAISSFFVRHNGRKESFLWQDPEDNAVTAHGFGVGDSVTTAFQLQRTLGGPVTDLLGTWDTYTVPRTNLLTQSQRLTWWATDYLGGQTVTDNAAVAPDGTITAGKYTAPTTASDLYTLGSTPGLTFGDALTVSIWLRADAPGPQVRIAAMVHHASPDAWEVTVTDVALTTSWARYSVACPVAISAGTVDTVGISVRPMTPSATFYVWGAQGERGSSPTAYIPTVTNPVTRYPSFWPALTDGFEPVADPVWSTVTIFKNGVAVAPGTGFTIGGNGAVIFTAAPAMGDVLTWSGSYYRRVRFDDDEPQFKRLFSGYWKASVALASVLP